MNRLTMFSIGRKLRKVNKIPKINRGGCAFVALYLHEYLKSKGIDSTICYLFDHENDRRNKEQIENGMVETCAHAMVRIGDLYLDSTGVVHEKHLQGRWLTGHAFRVDVSVDYVQKSLNLPSWNSKFDRTNVEQIRQILK